MVKLDVYVACPADILEGRSRAEGASREATDGGGAICGDTCPGEAAALPPLPQEPASGNHRLTVIASSFFCTSGGTDSWYRPPI